MVSSSCPISPGVRWNIIRTEGEPKVQLPLLRRVTAGRLIWRLALRWRRLIWVMSL